MIAPLFRGPLGKSARSNYLIEMGRRHKLEYTTIDLYMPFIIFGATLN